MSSDCEFGCTILVRISRDMDHVRSPERFTFPTERVPSGAVHASLSPGAPSSLWRLSGLLTSLILVPNQPLTHEASRSGRWANLGSRLHLLPLAGDLWLPASGERFPGGCHQCEGGDELGDRSNDVG